MAGGSPYNPDGTGKANNYQPPPPIESTFPDVGASGNLSVDPATLKQVAKAMQQDITELQATLNDIQSNGLVTSLQVGSWEAPSSLGGATGNSFAAISEFTNDLIAAHQTVIDKINQSAQAYTDAEANNVAAVNSVGSGAGGSVPGSTGGGALPSAPGGAGPGAGIGSGGAGAGSGGLTSGGPGGSLAGFNPPPPGGGAGGPGFPSGGGSGFPVGPGPGGAPVTGAPPVVPVPRPVGGPVGDPAPGDPVAGEPVPGEPMPGEPVPVEPVVGGPVIGAPGGGAADTPVLGAGRAGTLGGMDSAEGEMLADQMASPSVIGNTAAGEALAGEIPAGEVPNAAAADAMGAEAAGAPGFMPMGSGAGGQGEKEHERGTWLAEDGNVWNDDDEATPPVIRSGR
jgi:uncharacterized protein YukE